MGIIRGNMGASRGKLDMLRNELSKLELTRDGKRLEYQIYLAGARESIRNLKLRIARLEALEAKAAPEEPKPMPQPASDRSMRLQQVMEQARAKRAARPAQEPE